MCIACRLLAERFIQWQVGFVVVVVVAFIYRVPTGFHVTDLSYSPPSVHKLPLLSSLPTKRN